MICFLGPVDRPGRRQWPFPNAAQLRVTLSGQWRGLRLSFFASCRQLAVFRRPLSRFCDESSLVSANVNGDRPTCPLMGMPLMSGVSCLIQTCGFRVCTLSIPLKVGCRRTVPVVASLMPALVLFVIFFEDADCPRFFILLPSRLVPPQYPFASSQVRSRVRYTNAVRYASLRHPGAAVLQFS